MKSIYEDHFRLFEKTPYVVRNSGVGCYSHWHNSVELMVFFREANLYLGGVLYRMKPGEIAVVGSGVIHAVIPEPHPMYSAIIISEEFCRENNLDYSRLVFEPVINDDYCRDLCNMIFEENSIRDCYCESFISAYLLMLMSYLCKNYAVKSESVQSEMIKKALGYMNEHIGEKITVSDIAEFVHVSKHHFSREFKKNMGQTVIGFLNFMRCLKAASIILNEGASVENASGRCGFENPAYFSKVFRQLMGYNPGSLRFSSGGGYQNELQVL